MNKIFFSLAIISVLFTTHVKGQDPHFSQYFSSPLTLNPAMAGYYKGDYRVSGNFRQQWWSIGSPFVTSTLSYDSKLLQLKVPEKDILAAGVLALYDQSFSGGFESVNVAATGAYHKALDQDGINNIGLGFQVVYAYRSLNYGSLDFATQFNGSGFDTNLPSYENLGTLRKSYVDLNTGLLYTYKTENTEVYAGASVYHILRPNTSLIKNEGFKLPMRFTVHAGSRFRSEVSGNEFFIGGLYMNQAQASEKILGLAYGIDLNGETKVYAGSWYRFEDALIPFVGLGHKSFSMGLSYDIVSSSLKRVNPKNGSFEFSANLVITKPRNYYTNYKGGRIF